MFDIGWTELVVVAIVAILVVGPKDLPGMLRGFGKTMSSLRRMARDFQRQFDEALKEAELDDVKKAASKPFQQLEDARKAMQSYQDEVSGAIKGLPEAEKKPPEKATGDAAKAEETEKAATRSPKGPKRAATRAKPAAKSAKRTKPASKAETGGKRKPASGSARSRKTARSDAGATGGNA